MQKNSFFEMTIVCLVFILVTCSCSEKKSKAFTNTPIKLPENVISVTYDIANNYWCLVTNDKSNLTTLMVLVAGEETWKKETLSNIDTGDWHTVLADDNGFLWLAGKKALCFLNPRFPSLGWYDLSNEKNFPKENILDLRLENKENPLIVLSSGDPIYVDVLKLQTENQVIYQAVFSKGNKNVETKNTSWELVSRMPGSNHDLRGDILNDKFYMSGGLTAEYGYPMSDYAYSNVFEFDPKHNEWTIVADLGQQRIYCATGVLNESLWVVGGDILELNGNRYTTNLTQKVNLKTGEVGEGIPLNHKFTAPLAFNVNNRLYVLGYKSGLQDDEVPLTLESINENETTWRNEPDGPLGKGAIYGCSFNDLICLVVANKYVAIFNTATKKWRTVDVPRKVRSAQVGYYNQELWVIGGRDQKNQAAVQVYNFKSKKWIEGPELPRELAWGVAFNIGGELYVTGGAAGRAYSNRTFRLKQQQ